MTIDDKHLAKQATENGAEPVGANQSDALTAHQSDLVGQIAELEKAFDHVSAKLHEEARVLTAEAMDLVKHPGRISGLAGSLVEGTAAESLGEIVGAGLGTVLGPEGTVIGAEVGGMVGEVFGVRQGAKIAEKMFHQTGKTHPLKEDLLEEGSSKVGGRTGRLIGGIIGDALFDDAGGEVGEAVGDKIGGLAGELAYEHAAKAQKPK
ncbi:hypothetical protein [Methylotetracoccus oryzae]|uniref:hypothetical protein n=1 Tax=Methylotetracoccus oryzae TaxID=1919059 RepID=UPI00111B3A9D|nr:hypothetical protein [Methylotetracoccus oryzae]